jgi:hypothetical protein
MGAILNGRFVWHLNSLAIAMGALFCNASTNYRQIRNSLRQSICSRALSRRQALPYPRVKTGRLEFSSQLY